MTTTQHIFFRIRSFRIGTKLAVLFSLLIAMISAFVYFYLAPRWEEQELNAFAGKAITISTITAYSVSPALVFDDSLGVHETMQSTRQEPDLVYLVVYNDSGNVVDAINADAAQAIHRTRPAVGHHVSDDGTIFCVTTPIVNRGVEIGYLSLGLSLQKMNEEVAATRQAIAVMSILIFLVGVLAVVLINRAITKPLAEMVGTVELIAEGDLNRRAPVLSNDELGHFAASFNTMVDRLQAAYTEMETINRSLEQRVQERTRALQQEVNERTRSEAALRESEERYRSFFEDDLTGDYVATREGILLDCNAAFARMFGFASVRDALGSRLSTFFLDTNSYNSFLEQLREEKKFEYREEVMLRQDGELVHVVQNVIGSFNEHGTLAGFRGYLFDDTRRKNLEQQLLQAQKMESIGVLAGGIAHDFNNILGIILGFAHHARSTIKHTPELTHMCNSIISASERGANLVSQLLTFARKAEIQIERVQADAVMNDVVAMCRETFPKTILFVTDIPAGLPSISADPNQIHQTFLNLMLNARDAMPSGGTITVKAQVVSREQLRTSIPDAPDEQYLQLSVADTGTGMSRATR
ncbi:MAG TPA: HAMP domain-containing protein, partial [Bacteroidota bacterium]